MADEASPEISGDGAIGGAVVTISGDTSGLEQAEQRAKQIAAGIETLTADVPVRFVLSDADRRQITGEMSKMVATGDAREFRLTATLDAVAAERQFQQLMSRLRTEGSNLRIVPKIEISLPPGGSPGIHVVAGAGATLASASHGPDRRFSAPIPRSIVPQEFSRRSIERKLVASYEQTGGGYTAEDEQKLQEAAGAGDPFTFHKSLPTEINDFVKDNPSTRKLFRVSENAGRGGGADAFGELGDEYFNIARRAAGSNVKSAVEAGKASDDPELQYLANFYEHVPRNSDAAKARRLEKRAAALDDSESREKILKRASSLRQQAVESAEELQTHRASSLQHGDTFTAFGHEHVVGMDDDGELRLGNSEGLDVAVAGLHSVAADVGSLHRMETGRAEDPFGVNPLAAAGGARPPTSPTIGVASDDPDDYRQARLSADERRRKISDFKTEDSALEFDRQKKTEAAIARFSPSNPEAEAIGNVTARSISDASRVAGRSSGTSDDKQAKAEQRRANTQAADQARQADTAIASQEKENRATERLAGIKERQATILARAGLEKRVAEAMPEDRLSIIADEARKHEEGSLERTRLETRAARMRTRGEEDEGGSSRRGMFSLSGLTRRLGAGYAINQAVEMLASYDQNQREMVLAGNDPEKQLGVMMQGREKIIGDGGIVGTTLEYVKEHLLPGFSAGYSEDKLAIAATQQSLLVDKQNEAAQKGWADFKLQGEQQHLVASAGGEFTAAQRQLDAEQVNRKKEIQSRFDARSALAVTKRNDDRVLAQLTGGSTESIDAAFESQFGMIGNAKGTEVVARDKLLADSDADFTKQSGIIATQQLAHEQGFDARLKADDQRIVGHDEAAAFTTRIASELQAVELASPDDRQKTKALASKDFDAMRMELTGMHGGAIVHGYSDRGAGESARLQGKLEGEREKGIAGDITTAQAKAAAWNGDPTAVPPTNSTATGNVTAQSTGNNKSDPHRAAAADRGPTTLATAASSSYATKLAKPFKSNLNAIEGRILESKLGPDGMYHGVDGNGNSVTTTAEQFKNLTAAAVKRQREGPTDNLAPSARGERHAAPIKGDYKIVGDKLVGRNLEGDERYKAVRAKLGDSGQGSTKPDGTRTVIAYGLQATLTSGQYQNLRAREKSGGSGNAARPGFLSNPGSNATIVAREHEQYRAAAEKRGPAALAAYDANYAVQHRHARNEAATLGPPAPLQSAGTALAATATLGPPAPPSVLKLTPAGRQSAEHDKYRAAAADRGPTTLAAYDKNYAAQHQKIVGGKADNVVLVAKGGAGPQIAAHKSGAPTAIAAHSKIEGLPGTSGGQNNQAIVQKLDALIKIMGDFVSRAAHSPLISRGT